MTQLNWIKWSLFTLLLGITAMVYSGDDKSKSSVISGSSGKKTLSGTAQDKVAWGKTIRYQTTSTTAGNESITTQNNNLVPSLGVWALSFDGVDDYVNIPDSTSLDITGAIAIEAWLKPNTVAPTADWRAVAYKLGTGGAHGIKGGYGLLVTEDQSAVYFFTESAGVCFAGANLTLGEWNYVVGTYNPSDGYIAIYVNGDLKDYGNFTGYAPWATDRPLLLGGNPYNDGFAPYEFNGLIDQVAVYQRALSAGEVLSHYQQGIPNNPYPTDIVSYWPLEEGLGNVINDVIVANGNDGTILGAEWAGTITMTISLVINVIDNLLTNGSISQEVYNAITAKLNAASTAYNQDNLTNAIREINAAENYIQAQSGKKIDTTTSSNLLDLVGMLYQGINLDNFYAHLPLVVTFSQLDKVQIKLKDYPVVQEITISGEFQHIFYHSSEDSNKVLSLLSDMQSTSTLLLVPGIGTIALNISRDKAKLSYGTLYRNSRKFIWEMNVLAQVIGTNSTIPFTLVAQDDVSFTETGVMQLSARGGGTIADSVPIFGGAEFSFIPGSGKAKKSSEETNAPDANPTKDALKTYLEVIATTLSLSTDATARAAGSTLSGIFRVATLASTTETDARDLVKQLREIYIAIRAGDESEKTIQLAFFFQQLYAMGLITATQFGVLNPSIIDYCRSVGPCYFSRVCGANG